MLFARIQLVPHSSSTSSRRRNFLGLRQVEFLYTYVFRPSSRIVYTENCHASSQVSGLLAHIHPHLTLTFRLGYEIVSAIRNVAHRFGPVKHFKAYLEVPGSDGPRSLNLRSELQSSGVSLTDCPHNGRKNVADQMIMVDMLAYATDHPAPATLILISGDRDFAYAVSVLRLRRYEVVIISLPLPGAHISLKSQASMWLDWNLEILGSSSSSEGRAESPTALRGAFNLQSPSARRTSYLPTPGTPYSRDPQLPPKNETAAAVSGHQSSASDSGESFSNVALPEPKAIPSSIPASVPSSERPYSSPGLRERPEAARFSAPAYSAAVSPVLKQDNIGAAMASATSTPLAQAADNDAEAMATPSVDETTNSDAPLPGALSNEVPENSGPSLSSGLTPSLEVSTNANIQAKPTPPSAPAPSSSAQNKKLTPSPAPAPSTSAQKKIPPVYQTLVDALEKYRAQGTIRPLRSVIAVDIVKKDSKVFQRAGVKKFRQFSALAEKDKIVTLGENCHASSQVSGYEIVSAIRNVAHRFGPVKHFKAYLEVPGSDGPRSLNLRSELQSSGVSLTDCPHNGRKNVADQMIMVDMLAYATDHPAPATLILISGDRDFAYAVSVLRLRRYEVVIISLPLPGAHISLKSQASMWLDWNLEVL
ncbi:NYN domain-containing protein, partial [Mycena albidolilacea]